MKIEKVNKFHPDKIADAIAGAIIDLAYKETKNPKCAVEVLLGHGHCKVIIESNARFTEEEVDAIVDRIVGEDVKTELIIAEQDKHLADNQKGGIKCGDNGVFKAKWNEEYEKATEFARKIGEKFPSDGKYIFDFDNNHAVICQSNATEEEFLTWARENLPFETYKINPLGFWKGGYQVDTGCTNRKLGNDQPLFNPNGLHGKDLSKSDLTLGVVSNLISKIYANAYVETYCAIGDEEIMFFVKDFEGGEVREEIKKSFADCAEEARQYIDELGGFEAFASYGIV
ncbi:MAG: S-adenosylmethionine synthetase [Christensenellaceae bacterium]|jgi:S-adenosylmethionine synthetase|nr:S-adenosylmethionine synthetase [Christensenellaceae bacterium]